MDLSQSNGVYTGVLDTSDWQDGLYSSRIHDEDNSNIVISTELFSIRDGIKALPGREIPVYYADIQVTIDSGNEIDEYTCTWYKNAEPLTTGISNPTIRVVKRSDGTNLVSQTSMSGLGGSEIQRFKYDASGISQTQVIGQNYITICKADIDGQTRTFSWILGRHKGV